MNVFVPIRDNLTQVLASYLDHTDEVQFWCIETAVTTICSCEHTLSHRRQHLHWSLDWLRNCFAALHAEPPWPSSILLAFRWRYFLHDPWFPQVVSTRGFVGVSSFLSKCRAVLSHLRVYAMGWCRRGRCCWWQPCTSRFVFKRWDSSFGWPTAPTAQKISTGWVLGRLELGSWSLGWLAHRLCHSFNCT